MKFIKFHDVASSANTANVVNYIEAGEIKYVSTTATTVIFHSLGAGANAALDTTTITCANGQSIILADMLIEQIASQPQGTTILVDVNSGHSDAAISDISYAPV